MRKRIISICVICTMLLSMVGVYGASAEETSDKVYYYDSFENGTMEYVAKSGTQNYVSSLEDKEANGIFAMSAAEDYAQHASITDGAGYDGGKAIYINCDGTYTFASTGNSRGSTPAVTKVLTATENNAFMFEYKFKIVNYGDGTAAGGLQIASIGNANGKHTWQFNTPFSSAMSTKPFTENEWYTVIAIAEYVPSDGDETNDNTASGSADNENYVKATVQIIDETGKVVQSGTSTEAKYTSGQKDSNEFTFIPLNAMTAKGDYCDGFKAYLDDFSVVEYTNTSAPALYERRTSYKTENVEHMPEFELSFDMPISTTEVSLYKTEDETSTVDVTISKVTKNSFVVSPSENLELNTSYTLSYADVTSANDVQAGEEGKITFTTVDKYKDFYYDSFENGTLSETTKNQNYISSPTDKDANSIFVASGNETYSDHVSLIDKAGFDGGRALYLHCDKTKWREHYRGGIPAVTKPLTATTDNGFLIEYKFKIEDYGTADQAGGLNIAAIGNELGMSQWQNNSCKWYSVNSQPFDINEWYTVICTIKYIETENYVQGTVQVIDKNGEVVSSGTSKEGTWETNACQKDSGVFTFIPLWAMAAATDNRCDGFKAYIDDFSLIEYSTSNAPEIREGYSNLTDGATDVTLMPEIELSFDTAIDTSNITVSLYETEDTEKTVELEISKISAKGFTVMPTEKLELNTNYTLSCVEVLSLSGVASEETITFKTVDKYKDYYYDSFENGTLSETTKNQNYISSPTDKDANSIFIASGNETYSDHVSLIDKAGFDGGRALYLHCDKTKWREHYRGGIPAVTKPLTATTDNGFLIEYKFKIEDYGTGDQAGGLNIAAIGNELGMSQWQNNSCKWYSVNSQPFDINEWYTVICTIKYIETENYVQGTVQVIDKNGEVVSSGTSKEGTWETNACQKDSGVFTFIPLWAMAAATDNRSDDFKAYIDDFSLIEYSTNITPELDIDNSNIKDGATEVERNPEFKLIFDLPVDSDSLNNVKLYNAENEEDVMEVNISDIKYNSFTVTADGYLDVNKNYVLDFSEVTGIGGVSIGEKGIIKFRTILADNEIFTLSDDFEGGELLASGGYVSDNGLVNYDSGKGGNFFEKTAGYGTGHALGIKGSNGGTYFALENNPISIAENEAVIFTYRMKIDQLTTNTDGITATMGACKENWLRSSGLVARFCVLDGENVITTSPTYGTSNKAVYDIGKWYNITWKFTREGEEIFFVDAETKEIIFTHSVQHDSTIHSEAFFTDDEFQNPYIFLASAFTGSHVSVDDLSIYRIMPEAEKHKIALANEPENTEIMPDGSLTLKFNQPIFADGYDITVYEVDENENKRAYSSVKVTYEDFCKQSVAFSNLRYGHKYAIDYSDVVSVSGADTGANGINCVLEFTTSECPDDLYVYDEITCTGLKTGDKIKFTLTSKIEHTITISAGFYNRSSEQTFEGIVSVEQDLTVGKNNVEITLAKDFETAEAIRIFILDSFSTLKPLIDVQEIVAPKE